jgi:hypothetical protein
VKVLICLLLTSCVTAPPLTPRVIYATQEAAYVLDIFDLIADGRTVTTELPRR